MVMLSQFTNIELRFSVVVNEHQLQHESFTLDFISAFNHLEIGNIYKRTDKSVFWTGTTGMVNVY